MNSVSVSILLPVRNGAKTLQDAIKSIFEQTYQNWELIIIDDGSTDKTPELIQEYSTLDSRIVPIKTPQKGIVAALNTGLLFANGKYIARMDSDDVCHPKRLQKQVDYLQKNQNCDLVSCLVDYGGNSEQNKGYKNYVDWINSLISHKDIYQSRFIESPIAHPSVMFRWKLIDQFGSWKDGNFPEDYELWLRWLEKGVQMEKIPEKLLQWNDSPNRLSRVDKRYEDTAFYKTKARFINRWLKENQQGRSIWVWGAGKTSRKRALLLEDKDLQIEAWIDVDSQKIAKSFNGKPVYSIDQLPHPGKVLIASYTGSRGARDRIREFLNNLMWEEEKDYILCA